MSFNIGLSGMKAASKDLSVTGNNIANAGTVGFKSSRAEFADVYASSALGGGGNRPGSGVLLSDISQSFQQGNISYTDNPLDLAINGSGFFQVSNNGALSYTRAGYFGTDTQGFIVDNNGYNLRGYTLDNDGNLQTGVVGNLQIQTDNQEPKPTTLVEQTINLNSSSVTPTLAFDPTDATTYNWATSANIYDAQGNAHVMSQYFVKDTSNNWTMYVQVDGTHPLAGLANQAAVSAVNPADTDGTNVKADALAALSAAAPTGPGLGAGDALYDAIDALVETDYTPEEMVQAIANAGKGETAPGVAIAFDTSGKIVAIDSAAATTSDFFYNLNDPADTKDSATYGSGTDYWQLNGDGTFSLIQWSPAQLNNSNPPVVVSNGVTSETEGVAFNLAGSTQYSTASAVNQIAQNGYTTGEFAGIEINDAGVIYAQYTNGQTKVQGQVILANFANVEGLTPVGKTQWIMSSDSGEPVINPPSTGTLGSLVASALEDSNVELSDQLVNLIVAQRNYQANAKTIETESTVSQTLINLR